MKVFYLNDRAKSRTVYFDNLAEENCIIFKPQEGRVVEFPAPDGAIPWVKEWDNCTMIGYCVKPEENTDVQITSLPGSRYRNHRA